MSLNRGAKYSLLALTTIVYLLIIFIVSLLNTVTWITERPYYNGYHQRGLYAISKGFNVFFGLFVLLSIICIAYKIGDHLLRIADLQVRSQYNLCLYLYSGITTLAIPIIYMLFRYFEIFSLSNNWNTIYLITFSTFLALNAFIIFVFAIFLWLTSLLSILRTYNVFKYLVKLKRLRQLPPPPLQPSSCLKRTNRMEQENVQSSPMTPSQLPNIIGRVPRRFRYGNNPYYQHINPHYHHQHGLYQYGLLTPCSRRIGNRTASIPSILLQSIGSASTSTSSSRVIVIGQPTMTPSASSSSTSIIAIGTDGSHPRYVRYTKHQPFIV